MPSRSARNVGAAASASKPTALIVDDDDQFRRALSRALRGDYVITAAASAEEARRRIYPPPDVVLLDLCLSDAAPEPGEGLALLDDLQEQMPTVPVVMVTAYGDIDVAVECMRRGAADFLQKRANIREVRARLDRAVEQGRQRRRVRELESDLNLLEPRRMVGTSARMQEVRRTMELAGEDGSITVLIRGETGTGKELAARALHALGRRRTGAFVPLMLNAVPQGLVEAELFGHEAGAFTDARSRRLGCIERAHSGVLFLDEIGDVEPSVQAKLLRFLEERQFQRIGGNESISSDTQIVAATNVDLEAYVQGGRFRADLFYRLKVCEIVLPPLRDRREDIPALVAHFLSNFRHQGKLVHEIAADAAERIGQGAWPGNVRELRNALESARFRAELRGHGRIELADLPAEVFAPASVAAGYPPLEPGFDLGVALHRAELAYIERALHAAGGRKSEAWRLLGYSNRESLYRRVRIIVRRSPDLLRSFPELGRYFEGRRREQ